jgi:hypothetical protein
MDLSYALPSNVRLRSSRGGADNVRILLHVPCALQPLPLPQKSPLASLSNPSRVSHLLYTPLSQDTSPACTATAACTAATCTAAAAAACHCSLGGADYGGCGGLVCRVLLSQHIGKGLMDTFRGPFRRVEFLLARRGRIEDPLDELLAAAGVARELNKRRQVLLNELLSEGREVVTCALRHRLHVTLEGMLEGRFIRQLSAT